MRQVDQGEQQRVQLSQGAAAFRQRQQPLAEPS
jgi:hypothetical protein